MSTTQASPVAPRLTVPLADAAEAERAPSASARPRGTSTVGLEAPAGAVAPLLPWFTEGVAASAPTPWLVAADAAGKGSGRVRRGHWPRARPPGRPPASGPSSPTRRSASRRSSPAS